MKVEQVGDLPILASQMERLELSELLDEHFPDHGHWGGIKGGKMAVGWLLYILSENDHRLSHVEEWCGERLNTLSSLLSVDQLRAIDFSDDRLGRYLDRLSDDQSWDNFERALGSNLLQVYSLDTPDLAVVRTDSFNALQYRDEGQLCKHGYSKQRRCDQPFYKVMVSAVDSLTVPLAVDVLGGNGPDVDHYIPIINRVQEMFPDSGQLYVGDSQLGSMPNRVALQQDGDYYLCPLGKKQVDQGQLNDFLDAMPHNDYKQLEGLFIGHHSKRADVYFYEIDRTLAYERHKWEERLIMVYSPDYAKGLVKSFSNRVIEAQEKITNLVVSKRGRRNPKTLAQLHARIAEIKKRYKVEGCFEIKTGQTTEQVHIQRHKDRPARTKEVVTLQLAIEPRVSYIEDKKRRLGWQVYATNVPRSKGDTAYLVAIYRDQYKIEHIFDYTINRDAGLLPLYLKKEGRVKALIRLLMVAMRVALIIQHRVRSKLAGQEESLSGIYPGNKTRATDKPTNAMLLRAFQSISIVILKQLPVQMTVLSETQLKILDLLDEQKLYQQILENLQILRET